MANSWEQLRIRHWQVVTGLVMAAFGLAIGWFRSPGSLCGHELMVDLGVVGMVLAGGWVSALPS